MLTGDLQGYWWLPTSPDHQVPGTLSLSQDKRPTLLVTGSIDPGIDAVEGLATTLGQRRDVALVHGLVTNSLVTLDGVQLGLRELHFDHPSSALFELVATRAWVGGHVDPNLSRYVQLDLGIERLVDWRSAVPFSAHLSTEVGQPRRIELSATMPDPIDFDLGDGTIQIAPTLGTSGDFRRQATLRTTSAIGIHVGEPLTFWEWMERYVTPLRQLLSLALDRPVEVERLQLSAEEGEPIEVVWARPLRAELPNRSLLPNEMLFTAGDLADAGPERIKSWLSLSERFQPVLTRFFAARYAPGMYQEDLFHNLIEGVEAYHRRRCGDRPDEEAFRSRVDTVLAAAPSAHVEWLEKQLEYSGEYRLSERIEGLLQLHPWMAGDVVPRNVRRWSGSIAAFRNQRAHEDPKDPARKAGIDRLMGYTRRLTVLLEVCLLAEIGFEESRITEMIRRASEAYRIIKFNRL